MAIVVKKIGFEIDINEDEIAPLSVNAFIYQMINRLGYEHTIRSLTIGDKTVQIKSKEDLYELPIGEEQDL